ncbi:ubiquitin-like protein atg8 [Balamuthia mandrillaris]
MTEVATERMPFKQENSLPKRKRLASKIRQAHPDRVPVIVERHQKSTNVPDIAKRKFLAPGDISVAQFVSEIRKHIKLAPDTAIFLFVNGTVLPQSGALMSQVYEQHKDEDGFLYVVYSGESYFG